MVLLWTTTFIINYNIWKVYYLKIKKYFCAMRPDFKQEKQGNSFYKKFIYYYYYYQYYFEKAEGRRESRIDRDLPSAHSLPGQTLEFTIQSLEPSPLL